MLVVVPRGEYTPNTDSRALNGAMHAAEGGGEERGEAQGAKALTHPAPSTQVTNVPH